MYIDYDVEASNGGLTPSIRRSTAISSIDGKASVLPRRARGAASFAPLASFTTYLVGAVSFLVLDHTRLRGDAQHASVRISEKPK